MSFTDLKLFALSSNQKLAEKVSHIIGILWENQVFVNFQMVRFKSILKSLSVVRMCSFFNN